MGFLKAAVHSLARYGVIMAALILARFPARWFRNSFYPDGVPGWMLLIIILGVVALFTFALFAWAIVPLRDWSKEKMARLRQELLPSDN